LLIIVIISDNLTEACQFRQDDAYINSWQN